MEIEKEKVLRVSKLCKIDIENNLEKYHQEFSEIMASVDEILEVKIDKKIMLTPNYQENVFYEKAANKNLEKFLADKTKRGYLVFKRSSK